MDNIKLYEIDPAYVQFLSGYAAHLFRNGGTVFFVPQMKKSGAGKCIPGAFALPVFAE